MIIIAVTGTPGTGKTTLSKDIAKTFSFEHIDVNKIISDKKLNNEYDEERHCYVVDTERLNKEIIKAAKKFDKKTAGIVIDSHLSHFLPKLFTDFVIVTSCNLKILRERLIKRGYNQKKVRENLDSEIFEICYNEAVENRHIVIKVDTTSGIKNKIYEDIRNTILSL